MNDTSNNLKLCEFTIAPDGSFIWPDQPKIIQSYHKEPIKPKEVKDFIYDQQMHVCDMNLDDTVNDFRNENSIREVPCISNHYENNKEDCYDLHDIEQEFCQTSQYHNAGKIHQPNASNDILDPTPEVDNEQITRYDIYNVKSTPSYEVYVESIPCMNDNPMTPSPMHGDHCNLDSTIFNHTVDCNQKKYTTSTNSANLIEQGEIPQNSFQNIIKTNNKMWSFLNSDITETCIDFSIPVCKETDPLDLCLSNAKDCSNITEENIQLNPTPQTYKPVNSFDESKVSSFKIDSFVPTNRTNNFTSMHQSSYCIDNSLDSTMYGEECIEKMDDQVHNSNGYYEFHNAKDKGDNIFRQTYDTTNESECCEHQSSGAQEDISSILYDNSITLHQVPVERCNEIKKVIEPTTNASTDIVDITLETPIVPVKRKRGRPRKHFVNCKSLTSETTLVKYNETFTNTSTVSSKYSKMSKINITAKKILAKQRRTYNKIVSFHYFFQCTIYT